MAEEKIVLNKEQLEAVKHKSGPLLIIAGAGTGKTMVITERIKHLIEKEIAKTNEILALTFTEKASREMEERVDVALPYGYTQLWISTFHSFCDRILRHEALHIGFDPKYKLMTQAENTQFLRDHLFDFELDYFRPLGNPNKFVGGFLQHFSRLQDEDILPSDYVRWVQSQRSKIKDQNSKSDSNNKEIEIEIQKWEELSRAYKKYEELKVKESVMDFGDLIGKTLKLFRDRPNVLKDYQEQFKHVLVDEFQDTNIAQYELLKLLAPPKKNGNLTVVGDDSQSIYKFRGAAISNIIHFKDDYKNAKTIVLTKNYRSTQSILDPAYELIKHNNPDTLESKLDIDKNLKSAVDKKGKPVGFIHKERVENEANEVAKVIKRLTEEERYYWRDFAILVRANNHSEPFIRALQRNGIPYQFLGPGRLFKQEEIIDLISYLKVLYDFDDSVALYRVLAMDYFDIPAKDLIRFSNYAKRYNLSLFEAGEKVDDVFVTDGTKDKVKKLMKVVNRHLEKVKKETAGQLLYYFLEDTGLLQKLLNPDNPDAEKKAANISKFFDKLKSYEVDHEDSGVTAVVDWIELSAELGESPLAADVDWTSVNAVNLLTVHSAKGLEFPVVFLVNLVSQRFPTRERREQIPIPEELIKEVLPQGDYHEQEERRLFYVGMTRAMKRLYFTAADYYGEGKREKKLSPFIFEALGDAAVGSEVETEKGEQLSFLDYSPPEKTKTKETKEPFHVDYLSYSQIQTFQICPLHYKLRYILRIPTPPSAAQSFGISMHQAMKEFYEAVRTGKKASEQLLLDKLNDEWIKEGYKGKNHEKKSFKAAQKQLTQYYKKEFDPKIIPELVEQSFNLPLVSKNKKNYIKIGGKVDRVDKVGSGKIEIIDYKTGSNIPDQKKVDSDMQLTFYALAATNIKEQPFVPDPKDIKLSLYYFEEQKKITTKRTKMQLNEAVDEIFKVKKEIEDSDFTCSGHFFCQNCEYSLFCNNGN